MFGSLVISKSSLTFKPHAMDPLIRDQGSEDFEFVILLDDITYAALTKECYPPRKYDTYPEYCDMYTPEGSVLDPQNNFRTPFQCTNKELHTTITF